jgi:hypothetical protein
MQNKETSRASRETAAALRERAQLTTVIARQARAQSSVLMARMAELIRNLEACERRSRLAMARSERRLR